jgi:hypothetical protein
MRLLGKASNVSLLAPIELADIRLHALEDIHDLAKGAGLWLPKPAVSRPDANREGFRRRRIESQVLLRRGDEKALEHTCSKKAPGYARITGPLQRQKVGT